MQNLSPHIRASQRKLGTSFPAGVDKYLGYTAQAFGKLGSCFRRNARVFWGLRRRDYTMYRIAQKFLIIISFGLIACGPVVDQNSSISSPEAANKPHQETEGKTPEIVREKSKPIEYKTVSYTGTFSVPADTKAKYAIVGKIITNAKGYVEITTERRGPSGTSYATREVDCTRMLARYTADADTLEEAKGQNFNSKFGPLVSGSSTDTAARYACRKAGK